MYAYSEVEGKHGNRYALIKHTGSSTSKQAIKGWLRSGEYQLYWLQTSDMCSFQLAHGSKRFAVNPGDYVVTDKVHHSKPLLVLKPDQLEAFTADPDTHIKDHA